MPTWLHNKLEALDQSSAESAPTLVPVIARLIDRDDSVTKAYLCHPCVRYIGKIKGEGSHFCGYRNIQMVVSYLLNIRPDPLEGLKGRMPSVLDLQVMIEDAWECGMNAYGMVQTGGIRDTRKHIGTPEVSDPAFEHGARSEMTIRNTLHYHYLFLPMSSSAAVKVSFQS